MMELPRGLTYDAGKLRFAWLITGHEIEVYEMGDDIPRKRIGLLTTRADDGETVPFEQEAFEAHCNWFLEIAADAEIID